MPSNYEKIQKLLGSNLMEKSPIESADTLNSIIDSYTGAPVRSALKSMQDTGNFKDMVNSYANQFGNPSEEAPTSEQLVANDTTTAPYRDTLLPTAVSIASDPLSYLPLLGELKGAKIPKVLSQSNENGELLNHLLNPSTNLNEAKFSLKTNPEIYKYKHGLGNGDIQNIASGIGKEQELGLKPGELKSISGDKTKEINVPSEETYQTENGNFQRYNSKTGEILGEGKTFEEAQKPSSPFKPSNQQMLLLKKLLEFESD